MGSGGKDEKMEDATVGRKGGEEVPGGGRGDGKLKEKEVGQFSEGDKVLAYHGPLIYEAKIQRAEFRKKEWKYFVHYLGWSKNWDEWVGTDRLMALTDNNLEMQKQLFKNQNVDKQSKGRLPQGRQKAPTDTKGEKEGAKINSVPKGKKRKADSTVSEEKDTDEPDHVMKIPMPAVLKKQLVDDWELIQSGKSIKLPRSPNVEDILKKYRELKTKRESLEGDSLGEVLNGLQSYFNKALPAMLLYKQERAQYAGAIPDGSKPSLIYGAEHLLRLFVKLPELLVYTNMEEDTLTQLQQKLMDFLKFLQKHQSIFFLSMYDGPKGGTRMEPEEKKVKRDSARNSDDRKDSRDVLKPVEDKREKRVGTKAVEDRREKKDATKSSDDRKERKETLRVVAEEKRERKDGQRSSEEKREKKEAPKASEENKERRDSSKPLDDKKEKKDNSKPSDDKKEKRDGYKSLDDKKEKESSKSIDDKKEKESSKSVDDKKEKESPKSVEDKKEKESSTSDDKKMGISKSVDEKKEKNDALKSSDERKEKKDTQNSSDKIENKDHIKSLEEKKEKDTPKSLDEKIEKKDTSSKSSDEKIEKKDTSKSSDEKKEKAEDASVTSN